ncbi:MAG: hypothetical protein OXF54_03835 [Caldilineaceae bacterium]|nr:hypothetical protein [Caldilineaceae bacterium]
MQESDSHPRVLLVEGPDDKHVVIHLSERSGLTHNFRIVEKEGKDSLLDAIEVEVDIPGRTVLGIMLDANDDPNARWQAVTDRLNSLRQEDHFDLPDLPAQPEPGGTIIDGRLRIGIWLMPDNRSTGELEDFVGNMIPSGDPVWPRAQAFIDGIPPDDRKFAPGKIQRAKVHAWLATRESPRPMGLSIRVGDLDTSASNTTTFVNWLRELFKEMS